MTSQEIYKRFLLKINKNDSNDGVNILPSHFILLFNTEAVRWLGEKLRKEGDNIRLDQLDTMLESDVPLTLIKKFDDYSYFQLPEDFYRHASSFSVCDGDECKDVKVYHFEKKSLGFTATLADDFNRPQFDFEETPIIITKNRMKIYFDDFEIKKVFLSYYRVPTIIDIAGYTKIDGSASTDIDCDLVPDSIDEILNRAAVEVNREYKDTEGIGLRKDAITTEP
jgi:hypothetical protein